MMQPLTRLRWAAILRQLQRWATSAGWWLVVVEYLSREAQQEQKEQQVHPAGGGGGAARMEVWLGLTEDAPPRPGEITTRNLPSVYRCKNV